MSGSELSGRVLPFNTSIVLSQFSLESNLVGEQSHIPLVGGAVGGASPDKPYTPAEVVLISQDPGAHYIAIWGHQNIQILGRGRGRGYLPVVNHFAGTTMARVTPKEMLGDRPM